MGVGSLYVPSKPSAVPHAPLAAPATFSLCHEGGGLNCVVDGDTLWMNGEKIRVADIDAPETHPPRCDAEADLGNRATRRLAELVNAGPFEAQVASDGRDVDRYGRKLRVLVRDGQSLGGVMVGEGLARSWTGRRQPWC
ncbi:endonuclease YncB(thermonuclease family) [Sphingobium sp. B2D3A]|nr:endonuclease YncB(thermonuclease family) [Sphingobium sp. B2D3A]MCW2386048.1 endonuclease YncB(thermonuclease family) [Sphingobium sp. B2D3D]